VGGAAPGDDELLAVALTEGVADGETVGVGGAAPGDDELLAVALDDGVADGETVGVGGAAPGDDELLAVALDDGVAESVADTDGELLVVTLSDGVTINDGELLAVALTDDVAVSVARTDGELLVVVLTDGVAVGEATGVAEGVAVSVATNETELLASRLTDGETLNDAMTEGDTLNDSADGELLEVALDEADWVTLGLILLDGVTATVAELLTVAVTDAGPQARGTVRTRLLPVSATVKAFCERAIPLILLNVAAVPTPLLAPDVPAPATTKLDETSVDDDKTRPNKKFPAELPYKMPADASNASPLSTNAPLFTASVETVYG
jgi:hypothetical protein